LDGTDFRTDPKQRYRPFLHQDRTTGEDITKNHPGVAIGVHDLSDTMKRARWDGMREQNNENVFLIDAWCHRACSLED
jgi:hypothetical protein